MQLPSARYSNKIDHEHTDVINFHGLNKLPKRNSGELHDMRNLGSKYPGCVYPRPSRKVIDTLTNGHALFVCANGKRVYVDGLVFIYDGSGRGSLSTTGAKSIVDFYGNVIVMPDKVVYNYNDNTFKTFTCPDMDAICVFENRVWGVKGSKAYASKYMDYTDWTISTEINDAIEIALPPERGNYQGLIPLENHMLFATNNSTYEGYGTARKYMPQLVSNSRGTVSGKSMVEVDGRVFMLSSDGVTVYSGSIPRPVSYQLDETYISGVAGTDGRRYYLSLYNGKEYILYVCDTALLSSGISPWYKEDNLQVKEFASYNGVLYALTADNRILQFNSGEEEFSWYAETDEFNYNYLGHTVSLKLKIEAELEKGASLRIYLRKENGTYILKDTYVYDGDGGTKYYKTFLKPERAESFQIKIEGTGIAKVLSIVREVIVGSDV